MLRYPTLALALIISTVCVATGAEAKSLNPETIRAAVEKSLPLLTAGALGSMEKRERCFTCHNQGLPILALATAQALSGRLDVGALSLGKGTHALRAAAPFSLKIDQIGRAHV